MTIGTSRVRLHSGLRFSDHDCFLEVDGSVEDDPSLQSCGDARLIVRIQSNGYSGQATAWVHGEDLLRFREELASLNASLRGKAGLSSMSPGVLAIEVLSVSSRGHVAVQGSIGGQLYGENAMFWHSVSFGFEFEQSQLEQATRASWLQGDAA
ncbi:hypothetical protein [Rhizobacter sp. Root1221]|uniref:WapI family immunity protein n=1 Tax=Rhizobacter sp. Root1221 TaxID=1736433 RepID=UPI00190FDE49|nr:hypothetical protein [Rhizobacter sp. Root1221]